MCYILVAGLLFFFLKEALTYAFTSFAIFHDAIEFSSNISSKTSFYKFK